MGLGPVRWDARADGSSGSPRPAVPACLRRPGRQDAVADAAAQGQTGADTTLVSPPGKRYAGDPSRGLFQREQWLGRYADAATLSGPADGWQSFEQSIRITDSQASHFDIEFVAQGGNSHVNDIDIRALPDIAR